MRFLLCILLLFFVYNIKGRVITKDDLFEGDILLTDSTRPVADAVNGNVSYDAVVSNAFKWPNAVVPYIFDPKFDGKRRNIVREAIQEFCRHTCIKFVPRTNQERYIRFFTGSGCWSPIGMQGGEQDISIGYQRHCQNKWTAMHEMMHAVGFWHEQSRLDRDNYITILWDNIVPNMKYNFRKYRHGEADYYGEPYDYNSLMHYGPTSFSKNRRDTIVAKGNPKRRIGRISDGFFTQIDKNQLNKLYKCNRTCGGKGTVTPGGKKPKPGPCSDSNRNCAYWAGKAHCQKYRSWMHANCEKSCGVCVGKKVDGGFGPWSRYGACSATCGHGYQTRTRSCNRPVPANGGRNCARLGGANQRRKCHLRRCPRPRSCRDNNGLCSSWANKEECRKNPRYMHVNCKKSCGLCGSTGGGGPCRDNHRHCASWEGKGECIKNPRYMHLNCKKSCRRC